MAELAALLGRLVEIDSVNPSLVPGGAGEAEIARFVAEWLERAGLVVALQETASERPNVIGRVRGRGGGRSLMLNAHTDTVGLGGPDCALRARVEGNRLHGRGSYDMKGSLAATMLAAAELAVDPPAGDVIVTAVADEEYASIGTQAVVRDYRADAAILTEPTGLAVTVAHGGFVWLDIEVAGVARTDRSPTSGWMRSRRWGTPWSGSRLSIGACAYRRAIPSSGRVDPRIADRGWHRALDLSRPLSGPDRAADCAG